MTAAGLPLETIGIIVVFSLVLSIFFKKIGQNPVLGFILSGFLLGPFVFNFLHPEDILVKAFSELGLFVLLFYLGIELSFKDFLKSGVPTLSLALIDMLALALAGFVVSLLAGFSLLFSAAIAIMLFSTSSAIVGKFIIEKNLVKQKSAQLSLAVLIIQDFLGILVLVFISSFSSSNSALSLALTAAVFSVVSFYAVHRVSGQVEVFFEKHRLSSTEMALYGLGIGLIVATLAGFLGLSSALGAYFAGFALSEFRSGEKIKKQISFLRDFFILFFFVSFGASLFFDALTNTVIFPENSQLLFISGFALLLALIIVIVNAIVFTVVGPLFGLTNKESSELAVFLTPLGEFVIIIALSVIPVLSQAEALFLSPIAFLLILFTLLCFQPIYNRIELHDFLTSKIPALVPRPKTETIIAEFDSKSRKKLHEIGINLLLFVCLAWITNLLFNAIPAIGIPVPFGRTIAAVALFVFFASLPFLKFLNAFVFLWNYSIQASKTSFFMQKKFVYNSLKSFLEKK